MNYSFSPVRVDVDGIAPRKPDRLLGVMLHELDHHVEAHHPTKPWGHLKAKTSTHNSPSWCWVAATGWHHFYPDAGITPELIAEAVRKGIAQLESWEPKEDPAPLLERLKVIELQSQIPDHSLHCLGPAGGAF